MDTEATSVPAPSLTMGSCMPFGVDGLLVFASAVAATWKGVTSCGTFGGAVRGRPSPAGLGSLVRPSAHSWASTRRVDLVGGQPSAGEARRRAPIGGAADADRNVSGADVARFAGMADEGSGRV